MSKEREWRRRLRGGHQEISERTNDFNRELDVEIENYRQQVEDINTTARERISQAIKIITDAAREQDEALDRARNRAM
eukprot:8215555-Karenia_brevis.AAC.1